MTQNPQPKVADTSPKVTSLEIGKEYKFCTCGESDNQPFCNGAHKGGPFTPLGFTAEKEQASFCMCKQTKNPPYCDGSHSSLS